MSSSLIILVVSGILAGAFIGYLLREVLLGKRIREQESQARKLIAENEQRAQKIVFDANKQAQAIHDEAKQEERKSRREFQAMEKRLIEKEEQLDRKADATEKIKVELEQKVVSLKKLKEEVQKIYDQQKEQLEHIAQLSPEEARTILLKRVEEEVQVDLLAQIRKAEEELRHSAKERAKSIIADALAKYAAETASESTTTIVQLPSDDLKGRIIGREGRNINSFEQAAGVDVIVDDTPGSIVISGFDLLRRYIAKVALERLIKDGRIHPARIEETVTKARSEVNEYIKELGEKAVYATGIAGLPINLVKLLGRLHFRVTFGQNVLQHSVEVCFLAGALAAELGADVTVCKKGGLLHAIGKGVDHEIEGQYAIIGRDILKKFGIPEKVLHCVESHNDDVLANTIEAKIVQAAYAISIARPGATKDNLDNFIRRLEELENIAKSFDGVKAAFAIQSGREVRIFVTPEKISDLEMARLAHQISKKIEDDLQYPGQIKVDVIREVRAETFAA